MSLKKCCICGGSVVENRCTSCGMLMREETGRYHLNEDRSYHEEHCEPKKQNKSGGTPQSQNTPRKPAVPYGFGGTDEVRGRARLIVVVFVIMIAFLIIAAVKAYEDKRDDDLSKWFDDSASVEFIWKG